MCPCRSPEYCSWGQKEAKAHAEEVRIDLLLRPASCTSPCSGSNQCTFSGTKVLESHVPKGPNYVHPNEVDPRCGHWELFGGSQNQISFFSFFLLRSLDHSTLSRDQNSPQLARGTMLSVLQLRQYNPSSQNVIVYRPPAQSRFAYRNGGPISTFNIR